VCVIVTGVAAAERRRKSLRLTDRARDGIEQFCNDHRITNTAFLEAVGELLADGYDIIDPAVVDRAGEIDRERRSR
jgi:hypothetical protein